MYVITVTSPDDNVRDELIYDETGRNPYRIHSLKDAKERLNYMRENFSGIYQLWLCTEATEDIK